MFLLYGIGSCLLHVYITNKLKALKTNCSAKSKGPPLHLTNNDISLISCPSRGCLHIILDQANRVTFYGFLMALAKSESINGEIGTLPPKGGLFDDCDSEFSS